MFSETSSEVPSADTYSSDEEDDEVPVPDYLDNNYWRPEPQMSIEDLLADYL